MRLEDAHNIWDLRDAAKRKLPRAIFEFVDRGAEDDIALRQNREALDRIKLTPRTLRDVSVRDQGITLFGKTRPSPLIIAPTGIADLMSYRGELALARAASAAGIPFSLATSSTTSIADVAATATSGFWMQFYLWEKRDLSWAIVERAEAAGAEALILTVDTPVLPNREFNPKNGMSNPIRPSLRLGLDIAAHPVWALGTMGRYLATGGMPRFANYPAEIGGKISGQISRQANSASVSWADVEELRKRWPRTLIIKGVLNAEDAKAAAALGADGIIVSNHGGRNCDVAPASIDVLAGIVDAVGDQASVLWDSGVRRGSDVLKAMALGAKAVLIGRATLYGSAVGGEAGAARALAILTREIDMTMALLGLSKLQEIGRDLL